MLQTRIAKTEVKVPRTNLAIRQASLSEDREGMIALLESNLPGSDWRHQFKWRHEDYPVGTPWSWVIDDRQSGTICGTASVFPRPMYVDEKLVMGGQVGEFALPSPYFTLEAVLTLHRALFQPVHSGQLVLCYEGLRRDLGEYIFSRFGLRSICELSRYTLLLRSDAVLGRKLGKGAWTKPLITGANWLLHTRPAKANGTGLEVSNFAGQFDDEFTHLDRVVPSTDIVRASRSAEVLNWRYRDKPASNTEVIVARQRGELLAFLAYAVEADETASILELFGRNLDQATPALLEALIETCRERKLARIDANCSQASELKLFLKAVGFRCRERSADVFAYAKPGTMSGILTSNKCWPWGQAELNP